MRSSAIAFLATMLALASPVADRAETAQSADAAPIEVRVVIITTWQNEAHGVGELGTWRARWPLKTTLPFPAGVHPLVYDEASHVLAIVTGEATARAAASIMALGLDPRFDLTHAYWIVAGIAGVDPNVASVGSAAWARWVVDGDLAQELDPRDAPPDWPTGIVPYGRIRPYQSPPPPAQSTEGNLAYELNRKLVDWAFERTREVPLADGEGLRKLRTAYATGPAQKPPFVLEGDALMSARFWYGPRLDDWAERWVAYWTAGRGLFAMSAEEDSGILQGLTQLAQAGRVRLDRVLVLRTASDYVVQPSGMTTADFMAKEDTGGYPALSAALDNAYRVAAPVARYLSDHWVQTRDGTPAADKTR
jgi:purine nucleoside permease